MSSPPTPATAPALLARHASTVNALLATLPARWPGTPKALLAAMSYSLEAGGKRLRPALVLETFAACNGPDAALPAAHTAALAMEMVHTFSLVHDDLPAMDDDDLRRGRPTLHKVYDEAMAILAGDALLAAAFELLATTGQAGLVAELARAAGPAGMIGGQVLDIAAEGKHITAEELSQIHSKKTGALLVASCRMGALAAGASAPNLAAITAFATHTGLAFQIVDDILDVTSTPEQLGKATGKDAGRGKNTYPALHGLEASRARAAQALDSAFAALAPLGPPADGLRGLARFVVDRTN
jgi:geranylgeranyl pyrophosphate synthase